MRLKKSPVSSLIIFSSNSFRTHEPLLSPNGLKAQRRHIVLTIHPTVPITAAVQPLNQTSGSRFLVRKHHGLHPSPASGCFCGEAHPNLAQQALFPNRGGHLGIIAKLIVALLVKS